MSCKKYIYIHKRYTEYLHETFPPPLAVSHPVLKIILIPNLVSKINLIHVILIKNWSSVRYNCNLNFFLVAVSYISFSLILHTNLSAAIDKKKYQISAIHTERHIIRTLNTPLYHSSLCFPPHDIIFFYLLYSLLVKNIWVVYNLFVWKLHSPLF